MKILSTLSSMVIFLVACLFFVTSMEATGECNEIIEFSSALREIIQNNNKSSNERAFKLSKTEAVRNNFNDFELFMKCIGFFLNCRCTVDDDQSYLTVFNYLLDCPALEISEVPTLDFHSIMFILPQKHCMKMLGKLEPTDKFIQDILDYFNQLDSCKTMMIPVEYLKWSHGKVSNQHWVALLDMEVPEYKNIRTHFLINMLPTLIKDFSALKEKLALAEERGYTKASQVLSPIVNIITFVAATSFNEQNGENELWLPKGVMALIMEMLKAEMLPIQI